jgi:hypothetical protein
MRDDTLPLRRAPPPDDRAHVYIINSDRGVLKLVGDLLTDARARVTLKPLRQNLEVTLSILRLAVPDLLTLEIVPYRRDAQPLLERTATNETHQRFPIRLASTSPGLAEEVAGANAPLVHGVLPKPFELNDL